MDVKHPCARKDSTGAHCSEAGVWETWYWDICLVWEATFAPPSLHTALSSCSRLLLNSSRKLMAPFHGLSLASFSKWPWVAGAWLGSWKCAPPLSTLPECWQPLGKGQRVAAWGVLVQQVSSQLHCAMEPYLARNHTSGGHNAKQRSAAWEGPRVRSRARRCKGSQLSTAL